ncbi:MAG TPA: hypothetical protein EYQ24_01760 [Bacteroidetes bacterium]|nr:hypothetical protein [Bacteroidota bacterium]
MSDRSVQYVSTEAGEVTAVLVPIELWREIGVKLATSPPAPSHPLLLGKMRERLLKSRKRAGGTSLDDVLRQFGLDRQT